MSDRNITIMNGTAVHAVISKCKYCGKVHKTNIMCEEYFSSLEKKHNEAELLINTTPLGRTNK